MISTNTPSNSSRSVKNISYPPRGGSMIISNVLWGLNNEGFIAIAQNSRIHLRRQTLGGTSAWTNRIVTSYGKNGHSDVITSLSSSNFNSLQFYSSSKDGFIKLWDFEDGSLLSSWNLDHPILTLHSSPSIKNRIFVLVNSVVVEESKENVTKRKKFDEILQIDFSNDNYTKKSLFRFKNIHSMILSNDGNYIVFSKGKKKKMSSKDVSDGTNNKFVVLNLKNSTINEFSCDRPITTIAFHPTEDCMVAVGDSLGVISLFYLSDAVSNINEIKDMDESEFSVNSPDLKKLKHTRHHWHSNAVGSLGFTPDGVLMLSGGDEKVMVIWHLKSGKQNFLPRFGSSLCSITFSPDSSKYIVSVKDNSIYIIDAGTLKSLAVFKGPHDANSIENYIELQKTSKRKFLPSSSRTGLHFDIRSRLFVFGGAPHSLQFMDIVQDKHLYELQVAPVQVHSYTESNKNAPLHLVDKLAINWDGSSIATVDVFINTQIDDDRSRILKFWSYRGGNDKEKDSGFVLDTRIDEVHTKNISSIVYHPFNHMVVTCSLDGNFKIFARTLNSKKSSGYQWFCMFSSSFGNYECLDSSFSADGSLLYVAFGSMITTWKVSTFQLVKVITISVPQDKIRILECLPSLPFMVCVTGKQLLLVNLINNTISWSISLPLCKIIKVDRFSGKFAVVSGQKGNETVNVFSHHSPQFLTCWRIPNHYLRKTGIVGIEFYLPPSGISRLNPNVITLHNSSNTSKIQSSLVIMDGLRNFYILDEELSNFIYDGAKTLVPENQNNVNSLMNSFKIERNGTSVISGSIEDNSLYDLLSNAPSSGMDSMSNILDSYVIALCSNSKEEKLNIDTPDNQFESNEMIIEDEKEVASTEIDYNKQNYRNVGLRISKDSEDKLVSFFNSNYQ